MHAWEQIQQTIEYIEEHLNEEITIDKLAKTAFLSPFYYQRLFSRLVKKPVAEYIKLRRLAKATEVLLQKDKRILDVAVELGFTSHEHFSRAFKDAFGMTPGEYRRNPQMFNHMTKPELLLQYTFIDEGVPLISEGIVLEINRRTLGEPIPYIGKSKEMPVGFVDGLGVETEIDPLCGLWDGIHEQKGTLLGLPEEEEELGVSYAGTKEGYFNYFAGARSEADIVPDGYCRWELPPGEYIVCTFEAESFELLVMDAIYKAQGYVYNIWLAGHQLKTEAFCAERYAGRFREIKSMEIWLKILK